MPMRAFVMCLLMAVLCFSDIDGQGVMRLISGTIAVEEKGRVVRVGKVTKMATLLFPPSIATTQLTVLIKHLDPTCAP